MKGLRYVLTLALTTALLTAGGCGGIKAATNLGASCPTVAFINSTAYETEVFTAFWKTAQQQVATGGISLSVLAGTATTQPEARAINIWPCGLKITAKPDVPAYELNALPNCLHCPYTDPTGIVRCEGTNSTTGYCYSYLRSYAEVVIPASSADHATWEFVVIILHSLGYNTDAM